MSASIDLDRRHFLQLTAATGGALVLGLQLTGCGPESAVDAQGRFAPNAWIRIDPDDTVTLLVGRSEMGQGVLTALPMLIAEELEVDLAAVTVAFAPADRAYDNPAMFIQATGGSTSVMTSWEPLRQAGATAREMLRAAAAVRWQVPATECRAEAGAIHHDASGRQARYGELAADAARQPMPRKVALKAPDRFRLIGRDQPRLDAREKVTGRAGFGMDVHLPDLLIACIARPPAFGARLQHFDATAAQAVPGVRAVFAIPAGVAVLADGYWAARTGRDALVIQWAPPPVPAADSHEVSAALRALVARPGLRVRQDGDPLEVLAQAPQTLEAHYEVPLLAHATMEPMNATAWVHDGRCEVWAPTQNQGGARDTAAALTGLTVADVTVHTTHLGGGFGRRVANDFIAEAVACALETPHPVKVIWTREDDTRHDFYRPPVLHHLTAGLDGNGEPLAWQHRVAGPSIIAQAAPDLTPAALPNRAPRLVKNTVARGVALATGMIPDFVGFEGARENPYAIPNLRVEFATLRPYAVPLGFWRSVGHSHSAFAVESFIDELAAQRAEDPVSFRRRLLARHPRHLAVLEGVAQAGDWGTPLPPRQGRGIALHESFGSIVGEVAEVAVAPDGAVRVQRVVIAVDCGQVVNPLTVRAQMEGGMAYGLGAALFGAITIRDGGVAEGNFDGYRVLRMNEMPRVEVHIVASGEAPGGVGEPGTPPIAPAVCNAIFAATGVRIRRLPIDPALLKSA
jgi:CO/xanthine dehydrogenase Mo-binding subunit